MPGLASRYRVSLSDSDLTKIGLLAVLEAQAKFKMMLVLKSVFGLSRDEFVKLERWQLKQIVDRLLPRVREVDRDLCSAVEEFEELRLSSHDMRHKYIHALWGFDESDEPVAKDARREETLKPADLDMALEHLGELERQAQSCAEMTTRLIASGQLKAGEAGSPKMFMDGRWICF